MPILWDIGGVHVHLGESNGRARWQRRLALEDGALEQHLWTAIGSDGADRTEAIVARLAVALDLGLDDAETLLHDANDHWHPNVELNDFAIRLHDGGTPALAVANAGAAARWAMEAIVRIDRFTDGLVLSAEVGIEKPAPEIYLLALTDIGADPQDCIFIDDRQENVEGAEALGITGVLHTSNAETIAAVERWVG